jgi:gliding motility-associated-like protein
MKRNTFTLLFIFLNFVFLNSTAQFFPNPATLSTGQGTPGAQDPLWLCSPWSTTIPGNPMGETFGPTLINNNCAPGAWVDPASLPAPMNNGNWITGTESNCAANSNDGYRYFRLPINLPPDCNGNSVTVQGNYVLNLDGYVDNTIVDVFINGNSQGITGGSFAPGSQLSIYLDGPWVVGQNFIDILVLNYPNGSPGSSNPYGLLLVADGTSSANTDSDGDGMNDLVDVCPCDYGTNQYGCPDPNANTCNIDLIRTTFLNEGCIELPVCNNDCSMYFLNPDPHSGSSAQAYAQTLGANLISVQSAAENSCIMNELNRLGQSGVIWIGFNDEAVEGTFVWYDQAPVTYTNWNAGEPNNAGNENCTQIYPDGLWNDLDCNTANAQSIIEVNLCPLITTNDIIVCTNEPAVIAAEDPILGSHPYTFSWSNGAITQSQTVPSTDASYIVNVIDRYNCSGQDTANVITKPVPVATISPIDTLICTGEVTDFDITSNLANTVFNWTATQTNTAGASAGSGAAISQTLTTTGSVNGTVVYSVTPSLDGCIGTAVNATITVSVLPTINAGTDVSICPGTSTTLTATGGVTYTWDNGLGAGNTHTVTPSATTTYTVTGEDANGCENTDAVTVTLYTNPTATLTGSTSVCLNDANPTVTFSGSLGVAPYVFSYTVDGGTTQTLTSDASGQATLTVATTTAGSFVYELTGVEDANGCEVTVSSTVTVVVNDLPTITSPDVSVCLEGTVDLIASGAVDYTWSPATNLSATTGTQVTFTPGGNTTYTLTGEDANGCINSTTLDVTVLPTAPIFASADVSICPGTPTTISASGGVTYDWDNGLGAGDTHTITPTATTTYTVIGEDANGCEGTDAVTVTLYTNPTAVLTGDATICLNDATPTLTFSGSLGVAPYVFSYTINGGTTQTLTSDASGQATLTVATTTAGSFVYELTGVEDANGCEVTVSSTVTVVVNDLPTITSPDVSVCLENTIDLIASGAVDYAWSPATNLSATTGTQVTFTPGSTTTYTVTGEDANGCINSTTLDVTVLPTANIIASADVSICPGTPTTISASGGVTYTWDNGLGAGDTHTITPTATTTYTVIGEDANGCEGTDAVTVTLYTNPTATLIGNAVVCLNDAAPTLTFSGNSGLAPYIFSYTMNGGAMQTVTSNTAGQITVQAPTSTAGNYIYTLTGVEDANGCNVPLTQTVTVVVNNLPTITSASASVCLNETVQLSANGAVNYTWSPATSLSSTTGAQVTFTAGSTGTYTVTGTDANGCVNSTILNVTVLPLPAIDAGLNITGCENDQITLTATGAGPGGNYVWSDANVINGVPFPAQIGLNVYTVTGTDANGCENQDAVTVDIQALPVVSFYTQQSQYCYPVIADFINTTASSQNCTWTLDNGQTFTGCLPTTYVFNQPGVYGVTLQVESTYGCVNQLYQDSMVIVDAYPNAAFTYTPAEITTLHPLVNFTNTSTNATSYIWSFGDGSSITSEVSPNHLYSEESSGTYLITLIAISENGCIDSTSTLIKIDEEFLFFMPNAFTPDGNQHNQTIKPVFTSGIDPFDYTLLIFNRWGEAIFESHDVSVGWDGTYDGRMSQQGTYTWKIEVKTSMSDERKSFVGHLNLLK